MIVSAKERFQNVYPSALPSVTNVAELVKGNRISIFRKRDGEKSNSRISGKSTILLESSTKYERENVRTLPVFSPLRHHRNRRRPIEYRSWFHDSVTVVVWTGVSVYVFHSWLGVELRVVDWYV